MPTSINMEGNQLRGTGTGHFRNVSYIQIFNFLQNFSKPVDSWLFKGKTLIFTPPPKVTSCGSWHPSSLRRSGQEGRGKSTEKLKTVYLLRFLAVYMGTMYIWAKKKKSGQEKVKLICGQESQSSNRERALLESTRQDSDPQSYGSRHWWRALQKNVDSDRADTTGVGKLHPLPPKNTFPVVKGKKWGVGAVLCGRKRNKKRHLYEFSCYFSEVIIGQLVSLPKACPEQLFKGGSRNCTSFY